MANTIKITDQGFSDCQNIIRLVGNMRDSLDQLNTQVQNISPGDWDGDAVAGLKSAVFDLHRITSHDLDQIHDSAQSGIDFHNRMHDQDSQAGRQLRR
ncbi:MAG TPA: hypothetical protein VFB60_29135 [Ktedonobacteraceae bacterium]|nr:hypothetical protein [Ktedonobacteraceae bacterium]